MSKINIFLAIPLSIKTPFEILNIISKAKQEYPEDKYNISFYFNEVTQQPFPDPEGSIKIKKMWHEAKILEMASSADKIVFTDRWEEDRECQALYSMAIFYKIDREFFIE